MLSKIHVSKPRLNQCLSLLLNSKLAIILLALAVGILIYLAHHAFHSTVTVTNSELLDVAILKCKPFFEF